MPTIGEKIKILRKQSGLTQAELSEKASINLRTLQRIEKGDSLPRNDTLRLISNILDTTPKELFNLSYENYDHHILYFHLSVLSFLIIPFGNLILPYLIFNKYGDKDPILKKQWPKLINDQIVWTILFAASMLVLVTLIFIGSPLQILTVTGICFIIVSLNIIYPAMVSLKIYQGQIKIYYFNFIQIIK